MEKFVAVPEGVRVDIEGLQITVSGPKGTLKRNFASRLYDVSIERLERMIKISTPSWRRSHKAQVGCIAAHIKNMIKGVTTGFAYKLKIVYVHFPITLKVVGREVLISNFLGERSPRRAVIVGDSHIEVAGDEITVSGIDLESVGQTAANLERATRIPARDRRVFQDGIFIISKG